METRFPGKFAAATKDLRRQVEKSPAGEQLRTLPGVAWIPAYTIWAKVGSIDRFDRRKHLASYCLLAPRGYHTGDDDEEVPKGAMWVASGDAR